MKLTGVSAVVTGGGAGLGLATAKMLLAKGCRVTLVDVPASNGAEVAAGLGAQARFVAADVTDEVAFDAALDVAEAGGPLRVLVHCAGRLTGLRILDRDGKPGALAVFQDIINVNLVGTFNALRLAAARMSRAEPTEGERGVCVLTASIAAYEGPKGSAPYSASKAGVVGLTIVAARDLASRLIRVCSIAPGNFDTGMSARLTPEQRKAITAQMLMPARLGHPDEFARLAVHIVSNPMLNGETIRLDAAQRMAP